MLEHLGESEASTAIVTSIEDLLSNDGPKTGDLGGNATTVEVGKAIADAI